MATKTVRAVLSVFLCGPLLAATVPALPQLPADYAGTRVVRYKPLDVIHVRTRPHIITSISIEGEKIIHWQGGDDSDWLSEIDKGGSGAIFVKPDSKKVTTQTNGIATTASGNLYLFLFDEADSATPDIHISVQPDGRMKEIADGPPKYIEAAQVGVIAAQAEQARKDAEAARKELTDAKADADKRLAEAAVNAKADYRKALNCHYVFEHDIAPFHLQSVCNDGTFTILQMHSNELPAIYALRDGKPQLLDPRVENGQYILTQPLEEPFYLQVGKKKSNIHYGGGQ